MILEGCSWSYGLNENINEFSFFFLLGNCCITRGLFMWQGLNSISKTLYYPLAEGCKAENCGIFSKVVQFMPLLLNHTSMLF